MSRPRSINSSLIFGPEWLQRGPSESFMSIAWHINMQNNLGKPCVVYPSLPAPSFFSPNTITLVSVSIQSHCWEEFRADKVFCWSWVVGRGRGKSIKWIQIGWLTVTECWTAGLEDWTPFIIFACCIKSQFTELQGSGEADWLLTLSLRWLWNCAHLSGSCLLWGCSYGHSDMSLTLTNMHLIRCVLCLFSVWFVLIAFYLRIWHGMIICSIKMN